MLSVISHQKIRRTFWHLISLNMLEIFYVMRIWTADRKSNIFIDYCICTEYWLCEIHIQDYNIVLNFQKWNSLYFVQYNGTIMNQYLCKIIISFLGRVIFRKWKFLILCNFNISCYFVLINQMVLSSLLFFILNQWGIV